MGAIIDFVLLRRIEVSAFTTRYPDCVIRKMTESQQLAQKYGVIIPNRELDDDYYNFLVDSNIALASQNFRMRMESDPDFKARMVVRAESKRCRLDGEGDNPGRSSKDMRSGVESSAC